MLHEAITENLFKGNKFNYLEYRYGENINKIVLEFYKFVFCVGGMIYVYYFRESIPNQSVLYFAFPIIFLGALFYFYNFIKMKNKTYD